MINASIILENIEDEVYEPVVKQETSTSYAKNVNEVTSGVNTHDANQEPLQLGPLQTSIARTSKQSTNTIVIGSDSKNSMTGSGNDGIIDSGKTSLKKISSLFACCIPMSYL